MIPGFTGTQRGMTTWQKGQVANLIYSLVLNTSDPVTEAHHGMCIGSDGEFHTLLRIIDPRIKIHGHPCTIQAKQLNLDVDVSHPVKPPLERNDDIIQLSSILIATPAEWIEKRRSGTWYTIRHWRKMHGNHNLFIFYPSERYKGAED